MSRTLEAIEADIQAVKDANPTWFKDAGDKMLIRSFTDEKNSRTLIPAPAGKSPSNVILSSN